MEVGLGALSRIGLVFFIILVAKLAVWDTQNFKGVSATQLEMLLFFMMVCAIIFIGFGN